MDFCFVLFASLMSRENRHTQKEYQFILISKITIKTLINLMSFAIYR